MIAYYFNGKCMFNGNETDIFHMYTPHPPQQVVQDWGYPYVIWFTVLVSTL